MSKQSKNPTPKVEDIDLMQPDSVKKRIENIPEDDPIKAEGRIREVDEIINSLPEDLKEKKSLEYSLKNASLLGLNKDLQQLMKCNGLERESLPLVREYLTNKPDLAKFLVETPDKDLPTAMKMIKRKLGPKLEVLGEMVKQGYDPSDKRVKKLIEIAPSRRELEKTVKIPKKLRELGFEIEERKEIREVAKAENTLSGSNSSSTKEKEKRKEKLEKAKTLMNQAKKLASENLEKNKKEVNEKIKEIKSLVKLPGDWNKQDKESPSDMLKKLKEKIKEMGEFEESTTSYQSVEEIVANASGGLALKGIYFSNWGSTKTSKVHILRPPVKVESWNAQSPYETGFRQFSEGTAASRFSNEVESSGFTHADSVCGFAGTFVGEVSATYGTQSTDENESSTKATTTSVSATNFCRSAMKCFAIQRNCLHLTDQACLMALRITAESKVENAHKEAIRRFFTIYGSHVPYSVHQLGGLFFTMSTATSEKEVNTSKLMHLNANKLTTQVSAGFFGGAWGVAASDKHEHEWSKASNTATQNEHESVHYTFSVKSIGPHADNPATFKKALSTNNATWAILDRGDTTINVPVWELLRDEGEKYRGVAKLMEETWMEDEEKKRDQKKLKQTMKSLLRMAESGRNDLPGSFPLRGKVSKGGTIKFLTYLKTKNEAFVKANNFICEDPENNICELYEDGSLIVLTGWKADNVISFEQTSDGHHILYHVAYIAPEGSILVSKCTKVGSIGRNLKAIR